MKIQVDKEEIYKKLADIQNVVEKKNTMPILNHFLLTVTKENAYIIATDLETAVKEPITVKAMEDGDICVPARKLFEIVKEMDDVITLETLDSQWLKVRSGKSNFKISCLSPEDFPVWPSFEDSFERFELSVSLIREMIDRSLYAAGESDTRYVLNSLLFHIKTGGNLSVVGTDGHRLALLQKKITISPKDEKKLIISRKAVSELRRFLLDDSKEVVITIGKNHVLFDIEEIQFLTRLIDGTYPNYEQVIPTNNDKILKVDRGSLVKALRRVSIMSRERSNAVKMELDSGNMVLSATNPDLGEALDEVPVEYSGNSMTLFFNARYILDVLNVMASDRVIFKFNEPLSPAMILEEQRDDYICIVMPMRG
jgi:DNA polymerase-3 subunit beta